MSTASFEKAPLIEVICGITFNAPEFSSVHFGLYWQSIKDRYPSLPMDTHPVGEVQLLALLPKLRRVWFKSPDERNFIQLQADKFLYNWRKSATDEEYTHSQSVYEGFQAEWMHFYQWWTSLEQEQQKDELNVFPVSFSRIEPTQYELTYLNHMDARLGWHSSEDTPKIFSFLEYDWPSSPLGQPKANNISLEFDLPDPLGTLTMVIAQGMRLDDNTPILICELTARSLGARIPFNGWFEDTHEFVVQTFISLLREEIKEEWGLKWLEQ